MIKEAGYNGQKAVIINPTDFATIGPLGDITYDMFKKIGINVEMQGDRLGHGRAATGDQGAGGKGRLVGVPHLVHRWLHHQSGRHRAIPRARAQRLVRLV